MATSVSGSSVFIDTSQLKDLGRQLRKGSPELARQMRTGLREVGQVVAEEAKHRASFSKRIPGSIRVRTTSGFSVSVVAGDGNATDAAPIENKGKGFVRHPVFGNRDVWTSKGSHPAFLAPAADASQAAIEERTAKVISDTLHAIGL